MAVFSFLCLAPHLAYAQNDEDSSAFRTTEFPLPRFVSLRSDEVYVRTGPGRKYPVSWIFKKKALPVEIVLEYDAWRKIKDIDGEEGWIHKSLLSGRRTGIVSENDEIKMYKKPSDSSGLLAKLEPKFVVKIDRCGQGWCYVDAQGFEGWVQQKSIWGVYADEQFD